MGIDKLGSGKGVSATSADAVDPRPPDVDLSAYPVAARPMLARLIAELQRSYDNAEYPPTTSYEWADDSNVSKRQAAFIAKVFNDLGHGYKADVSKRSVGVGWGCGGGYTSYKDYPRVTVRYLP